MTPAALFSKHMIAACNPLCDNPTRTKKTKWWEVTLLQLLLRPKGYETPCVSNSPWLRELLLERHVFSGSRKGAKLRLQYIPNLFSLPQIPL